jgi:hypothetical protein
VKRVHPIFEIINITYLYQIIMIYLLCRQRIFPYFIEYANSIANSSEIEIMNYGKVTDVKITDNNYYIFILDPEIIQHIDHLKGHNNLCIFNGEQLTRARWENIYKRLMNDNFLIYDYDMYQMGMMNYNLHRYLPYQMTKTEVDILGNLVENTPKKYDVAFCSANSHKRMKILKDLNDKGLKTINVSGWGIARDKIIAQAKILINIHHSNDFNIYEHLRCDRWVLSGLMVVSETSLSDDMLDIKDLIFFEDYDKISDYTVDIINNYDAHYSEYKCKLTEMKDNITKERAQYLEDFIEQHSEYAAKNSS